MMIPDPPEHATTPFAAGGEGTSRSPGVSWDAPRLGWIECVICQHTIALDEYRSARCWTDPAGITCAAHHQCLVRVGEHDLHLPPPAA